MFHSSHLICGQKQNSLALRLPHQSFGRKPVNCSPPIPFSDLWEKPSLVLRFPLLTGDRKPVYSSILYVRQSKSINLVLRFPRMNPMLCDAVLYPDTAPTRRKRERVRLKEKEGLLARQLHGWLVGLVLASSCMVG